MTFRAGSSVDAGSAILFDAGLRPPICRRGLLVGRLKARGVWLRPCQGARDLDRAARCLSWRWTPPIAHFMAATRLVSARPALTVVLARYVYFVAGIVSLGSSTGLR